MSIYIRTKDRDYFQIFDNELREYIINECLFVVKNLINSSNLTDLDKLWSVLLIDEKKSYFDQYINIFQNYRLNTINEYEVSSWAQKFIARLFLYLKANQVFTNFNALAFDTEKDRYTLTKWHSYDERHKDGNINKTITDTREYDYPQYTTDVIMSPTIPILTEAGYIKDNETSLNGVLTSVNINDNNSVSDRTTSENQLTNSTSGESDIKESWSIPKEVINFASQRFNQMNSLKPIDFNEYYDWMIPLFCTFFTQSDHYN